VAPGTFLGEFEHLVLLAVLQLDEDAYAIRVREYLTRHAERSVSRGALYATLERLKHKQLLTWDVKEATAARGGLPRRRFRVTAKGLRAVRATQRVISRLSAGLEEALE
jgi:PadR family transcriptional regulator PadR